MRSVSVLVRLTAPVWLAASGIALTQTPPPGGQMPPGIPIGTVAPDGIGVTVERAPSAGVMEQGPWETGSMGAPLQAGANMPAGSVVQALDGASFDLNAAVARQPTVLIFYRGGWCPYCNAHLRELQKSVTALKEMGYQLLAVSTDTPAALRNTMEQARLDYQLLSDSKVEVATRFGLRYKVVASYLDHVKNDHQTDLAAQNGGYLITPAAYILDTRGVIRFAYVNNNYAVRISQDALLKAARAVLQ